MNILLIASYFPPTNVTRTLCTGKRTRFLTEQGHDVRTVTEMMDHGLKAVLRPTDHDNSERARRP